MCEIFAVSFTSGAEERPKIFPGFGSELTVKNVKNRIYRGSVFCQQMWSLVSSEKPKQHKMRSCASWKNKALDKLFLNLKINELIQNHTNWPHFRKRWVWKVHFCITKKTTFIARSILKIRHARDNKRWQSDLTPSGFWDSPVSFLMFTQHSAVEDLSAGNYRDPPAQVFNALQASYIICLPTPNARLSPLECDECRNPISSIKDHAKTCTGNPRLGSLQPGVTKKMFAEHTQTVTSVRLM